MRDASCSDGGNSNSVMPTAEGETESTHRSSQSDDQQCEEIIEKTPRLDAALERSIHLVKRHVEKLMRTANRHGKQLEVWTREVKMTVQEDAKEEEEEEQPVCTSWLDELDWSTDDNDTGAEEENNEPNDVMSFIDSMMAENAACKGDASTEAQRDESGSEHGWKTATRKHKRSW